MIDTVPCNDHICFIAFKKLLSRFWRRDVIIDVILPAG